MFIEGIGKNLEGGMPVTIFTHIISKYRTTLNKVEYTANKYMKWKGVFYGLQTNDRLESLNTIDKKLREVDITLKSARESLGGIAMETSSRFYESESSNYHQAAQYWLIGLMTSIVLSIITVIAIFQEYDAPFSDTSSGSIMIRIFVGLIAFFIINVCARNYKSCQHNHVINKHRSQSLKTFRAFAEYGKEQPEITGPILKEAAKTIFDHQPTGFGTASKDIDNSVNITELVKGLNPNG